ncbi:ATP-binding protein [Amycolatopsis sp. NPDC004625]|uniref:ATP-binding protein n=1 Tax=Amycolatopsis sp. NPDC004625 TaxID=3154670 RepID=UPI0033A14FB1
MGTDPGAASSAGARHDRHHRAAGAETRPARARMVSTARDCASGCVRTEECRCTPAQRARYLARIPQWLLDRVDLFLREVTVAEPDPSLPSWNRCGTASPKPENARATVGVPVAGLDAR